ncbi:MAG: phospholipase A, partial [Gammaproteobacteria bacterium]|nr:phospholipase A [Gammaproteobacteria bacterium]NIR95417.1 phospholipase A [Gammaproteobacteria bacterium]NIW45587.1 hypothetical protein [Gammaproteobacteria bacterium]NIX56808.1 hypothetical protein [candidate division Zixibacteria bacterium]
MKSSTTLLLLFQFTVQVYANEQMKTEPKDNTSALDNRIRIERQTRYQSFVLTPHKPNYILPFTYNDTPNSAPLDNDGN